MRNVLHTSVSVPKNAVKACLIRMKLSLNDFYQSGKVEVAPGHYFRVDGLSGRCQFVVEALDEGRLDPQNVPIEVRERVLGATPAIPRAEPMGLEEQEALTIARLRKRVQTTAA